MAESLRGSSHKKEWWLVMAEEQECFSGWRFPNLDKILGKIQQSIAQTQISSNYCLAIMHLP